MTDPTLGNLVRRAAQQDTEALDQLLAVCEPAFRRMAQKACLPADVDDAVQELLVQVSQQVGSLRVAAAFFSWSMRSLVRKCMTYKRRALRWVLADQEAYSPPSLSPRADQLPTRSELRAALLSLSDSSRAVLLQRDVLGCSAQETAELLGLSVEAVKSRLRRARAQLRSALQG